MDTQKVSSPIKQNVLAGAGAGLRANNYLGAHTLTTTYTGLQQLERESGVLPVIIL